MIDNPDRFFPQWRLVHSEYLAKKILVRRPTIADVQVPIEEMWVRLCRDEDKTPLFPSSFRAGDADPKLVEEVCRLATENPISEAG